MTARLISWWTFFRVSVEERLVYRGDFALGTLMRFLPIITQIFLWWSIFEVRKSNQPDGADIEGYVYQDMVAYYLLVMISRAFSSMPGLTTSIATQVRNGEIKKFLIQPVDLLGCLLLQRIAHKLVYYLIALLPFAFVFFLCRSFFVSGWPEPQVFAAYVASLVMGFLLGFFIEACLGMISFWWLEVTSLTFVYMLLSFFLSGHMFPLDLLPESFMGLNLQMIVEYCPLNYLAYFPTAVFLGKVEGADLVRGLWVEAAWLTFFIVLARIMWWRGVKRYSGFGG